VGKLFSARVRKKPPVTLSAKNSQIKKVISASKRQAGWKALRSRPVMPEQAQNMYRKTKITRKIMRICTGKALDMQEIYDKQKREEIQRAMQDYLNNPKNQRGQHALGTIYRELGSIVKYKEFFETLQRAQLENLLKIEELE
jgi:succinylglutamate desuccinylase